MKKTLSLIISLIFIITCFTSCGPEPYGGDNKRYDLVKIDGQDYLVIKDEIMTKIKEIEDKYTYYGDCIAPVGVYDTIEEFVDTVKNGKLSDEDLAELKNLVEDDPNGITICNFEDIQAPKVPDGFEVTQVDWNGEYYYYSLSTKDKNATNSWCEYYIMDKDKAELWGYPLDTEESILEKRRDELTEIKKLGDRTEYYWVTGWKDVWYSITVDETIIRVREDCPAMDANGQAVPDAKPSDVYLTGMKDNWFLDIRLRSFSEKPTVEWLSQFGIEDYKEA